MNGHREGIEKGDRLPGCSISKPVNYQVINIIATVAANHGSERKDGFKVGVIQIRVRKLIIDNQRILSVMVNTPVQECSWKATGGSSESCGNSGNLTVTSGN